jgi:MFS family permease
MTAPGRARTEADMMGWALFHDRVIGRLGVAQGISSFGSAMVGLAFVYLTYSRTGSVMSTALVTASHTLPTAVLGVWAGRLAQHRSRRTILLVGYSAKLALYVTVAVVEVVVGLDAATLLLFSFATGVAAAMLAPAWTAFERDVVPSDRLDTANAFYSSLTSAAQLLGAVGGGFLLATVGPAAVFVLNAASYLPELTVLAHLHTDEDVSVPRPHQHDLRRALAVISDDPSLRRGFRNLAAVSLLAAPLFQLLPALASEIDGGAHTLGFLTALIALGGTAVTAAMARLRRRHERRTIVTTGLALTGLALLGVGLADVVFDGTALYPPVIVGLTVVGLAIGLGQSALSALVQSDTPEELAGSIFAIYAIVYTTLGPLGAVVLAHASSWIDVYGLVAICGAVLLAVAISDRHAPSARLRRSGSYAVVAAD